MPDTSTTGLPQRTPEEIQRDMQATRAELDKSVDRLESKLTPDQMIAGAERWLTGGRVAASGPLKDHIAAFVRGYPLPSALIGAAAAWVVLDRFLAGPSSTIPGQGGTTHGHRMGGDVVRGVTRGVAAGAGAIGDAAMGVAGAVKHGTQAVGSGIASTASATGHAASMVGHGVADAASAVGHAASSAAHTVGHTVAGTAQGTAHLVGSAAHSIGHTAHQVGSTVSHTVSGAAKDTGKALTKAYHEYPLGMGLVAAGVGLAAGLLIPHTKAEDKALGHVGDKAKDQVARLKGQVTREIKEQSKELKGVGESVVREIKGQVGGGRAGEREDERQDQDWPALGSSQP